MSDDNTPVKIKPGYTEERVELLFETHDLSPEVREKFLEMKALFRGVALTVARGVPDCPHKTISINKIIEAKDAACLALITESVKS